MNADILPTEIAVIVLLELLFGFGYNALVAYWTKHNLMHVSWAVVIGVTGTLLIPALFWFGNTMPFWQSILYLLLCFAASGTPMIAGSMHRTVQAKDDKKRRHLGNAAMRIRDEVVMDLNALANEIAERSKANAISLHDLPDYVHRLHRQIGSLKTL
jgi:hypothetical protein